MPVNVATAPASRCSTRRTRAIRSSGVGRQLDVRLRRAAGDGRDQRHLVAVCQRRARGPRTRGSRRAPGRRAPGRAPARPRRRRPLRRRAARPRAGRSRRVRGASRTGGRVTRIGSECSRGWIRFRRWRPPTLAGPRSRTSPSRCVARDPARGELGDPGGFPFTRGVRARTATAAAPGRCGSTPASRRPRRPTPASSCCATAARRGSRRPSTCRRSSAWTPTTRSPLGEVGRTGVAIDSVEDLRILFDGLDLGEVSTSMTINAPASRAAAALRARRRGGRRRRRAPLRARSRTTSSRSTWRAGTTSSRRAPPCA